MVGNKPEEAASVHLPFLAVEVVASVHLPSLAVEVVASVHLPSLAVEVAFAGSLASPQDLQALELAGWDGLREVLQGSEGRPGLVCQIPGHSRRRCPC